MKRAQAKDAACNISTFKGQIHSWVPEKYLLQLTSYVAPSFMMNDEF